MLSRQGAYLLVSAVFVRLEAELDEGVANLRRLESTRLDTALVAIWPRVKKGELGAIEVFLKISAQRCKMFGINAPASLELSTPDGKMLGVAFADECVRDAKLARAELAKKALSAERRKVRKKIAGHVKNSR